MNEQATRQAAYELLSRLYLGEPDAALVSWTRKLPGFAELLPDDDSLEAWLEEEAAEYQWLFGMNVYPYESIFTGHDLMLNGEGSDRVAALYAEAGFDPGPYKVGAPDHIGIELALMRDLIAAERAAGSAGDAAQAHRARTLQAPCLHEHLAVWSPIFALTLQRIARRPLHRLLAELTVELVLTDVERRIQSSTFNPSRPEGDPVVQGQALQPEEGINSIVRRLVTPAEVGVFITRADIGRLSSELQVPVSMGDRFGMLRDLFTSAAQYDLLQGLLESMGLIFAHAESGLTSMIESYPAWQYHARHWQDLIANGRLLVEDLHRQARL